MLMRLELFKLLWYVVQYKMALCEQFQICYDTVLVTFLVAFALEYL